MWGTQRDPAGLAYEARQRDVRQMTAVIPESAVTCPACGFTARETMPTDACQYYYECLQCKTLLKPEPGHCCVFCSYGTVPCPPVQQAGGRSRR